MDALTPRSRQLAMEARTGDQETPRSARAQQEEEAVAQWKEAILAAARPSPRPGSPSVVGASGVQAFNLKQMAARAATPGGGGSGPSTPRGGLAAGLREKEATASGRSPRGGDQTPRRVAMAAAAAAAAVAAPSPRMQAPSAAPAPAPAALGGGDVADDGGEGQASPGASDDESSEMVRAAAAATAAAEAAAARAAATRAQPLLRQEAPVAAPAPAAASAPALAPAPAAPSLQEVPAAGEVPAPSDGDLGDAEASAPGVAMSSAARLGFWRTRSSGLAPSMSLGGAAGPAGIRRTTGPGGLTAAEILLMDARRPSRADDDEHHFIHSGAHGLAAPGVGHVASIQEEAAAGGAAGDEGGTGIGTEAAAAALVMAPGHEPAAHPRLGIVVKKYAQPMAIVVLTAALVVTMVFTFTPGLAIGGGAAVAAPAAATAAEVAAEVGGAAARAAGVLGAVAGFAVAPLVADVIGFVGAQNPAWLQPGLDPSKLAWGVPPPAHHCASMAAMPAVQFLCTGNVAGGVRYG